MRIRSGVRFLAAILGAFAAISAVSARADLIQLNTGVSLTWDRGASPTNSPTITLSVMNTGTPTNLFNGWELSLQMIPQSGASGTLQVNAISNPSGNVLSKPDVPSLTVTSDPNRGAYTSISNANTDNTQDPGTGNLINLNFNSPDGAVGLFNLVAINQAASSSFGNALGTIWIDSDPLSTMGQHVFSYSNLGFTDGASLVLGTINVQAPAGVPEPGSLLLLTVASGVLGGYGWRRKRRAIETDSVATPAATKESV